MTQKPPAKAGGFFTYDATSRPEQVSGKKPGGLRGLI